MVNTAITEYAIIAGEALLEPRLERLDSPTHQKGTP